MNTQKSTSRNTKILIVLAIFILLRTPWGALNSFHYLLLCLFLFCLIMRMSNVIARKQKIKQMEMQRAKKAAETTVSGEVVAEEVVAEAPIVETSTVETEIKE